MKNLLGALIKESFYLNPLTARNFNIFEHSLLEDRLLHKGAWFAKHIGTHLSIQDRIKRSNFQNEISRSWKF